MRKTTRRKTATRSSGASKTTKVETHHHWTVRWTTVAGGIIVILGAIVFVLLTIVLLTPDQSVNARAVVTVTSVTPSGVETGTVRVRTPRVLEAIARWSGRHGTQTEYFTAGDGAILQKCLGYSTNDGRWLITINGQTVTDLFHATLRNGDEVRLQLIPTS